MFINSRKKDLARSSWDGLLNHQLLSEEGGLGILTPEERRHKPSAKQRTRVTKLQNNLRAALYDSATAEVPKSDLGELLELLASFRTRIVETKKSSALVEDWSTPGVIRRSDKKAVKDLSLSQVINKVDPFEEPKSYKDKRKSARKSLAKLPHEKNRFAQRIRLFWQHHTVVFF
jgi:hypothetical protein